MRTSTAFGAKTLRIFQNLWCVQWTRERG